MRICFVQPNTAYQVQENKLAFALTFPQIILNLELEEEYCIFVDGMMNSTLGDFLIANKISHVFISCITSTFPRAVNLAKQAKEIGCITVLGGIFATISAYKIVEHYDCFNYIISGGINRSFLSMLESTDTIGTKRIINIPRQDVFDKPLSPIMLNSSFTSIFSEDLFVCYELGCGCLYNCSFCTLRQSFGCTYRSRNPQIVQFDLTNLSKRWKKLKLIDDDIFQAQNILAHLDLSQFKQIIIETRINHIDEAFVRLCKNKGITHIITGIEAFDDSILSNLNKAAGPNWCSHINSVIDLCNKHSIVLRPVVMLNPPGSTLKNVIDLLSYTKEWQPENNVELLMSLYTPHPGTVFPKGVFFSNDLSLFDHLHPVFMPNGLEADIEKVLNIYEQIVSQTSSQAFNPPLEIPTQFINEYIPFFK